MVKNIKKIVLYSLLFIGLQPLASAQTHFIDSLKKVLKTEKEDTNKVNTLNDLSTCLWKISKNDSSLLCANLAKTLAEKIGFDDGKAYAFKNIGTYYNLEGKYPDAIKYYQEGLSIFEKLGNKTGASKCLGNIGLMYFYQNNYTQALEYCNKALILAQDVNDKHAEATNLGNIGLIYMEQDNGPRALVYFSKASAICVEIKDLAGEARNVGNIGIIYEKEGNYSKALENYFKALDIDKKNGERRAEGLALGNIANIYSKQSNKNKALECYLKALKIFQDIGDKYGETRMLSGIGNIYEVQGDFTNALEYHLKSLKIAQETGDQLSEGENFGGIGNIYEKQGNSSQALEYYFKGLAIERKIGDKEGGARNLSAIGDLFLKQKKYSDSKLYLDSALALSKKTADKENIKSVYGFLAELDSAKGDYAKGWEDYKNYMVYRDSLNDERTLKEEMNYEYARQADSAEAEQDKQKAINLKESQRQKVIKNSFIGGFSIMFLAAGLFFFQRRRISKEKKRSDELLLNILPAETAEELKATGKAKAKSFDMVSVMFTDFKDFTKISEKLSPTELVEELHCLFHAFDNIIHNHNLEKIKTIGDSYMAAGGLPVPNKTNAKDVVSAALEIVEFMERHKDQRAKKGKEVFEIRIGINTGPVVAGIVGVKKFAYDIWGDTVNLASRMESSGEPGKVNISGSTYELVKDNFNCTHRGKIQAKNKGEVDMYFVEKKM